MPLIVRSLPKKLPCFSTFHIRSFCDRPFNCFGWIVPLGPYFEYLEALPIESKSNVKLTSYLRLRPAFFDKLPNKFFCSFDFEFTYSHTS